MSRLLTRPICLAALVLAMTTPALQGATITSAPFSFGFGMTATGGGTWNDEETSGVNTPTTQGDFSFAPVPTGDRFTTDGSTFPNRVLTDAPLDGYSAAIDKAMFEVPITANYTGAVPGDVNGTAPNYKLRLEITSISIYAGAHPSSSLFSLAWDETTAGHAATSPSTALPVNNDYNEAASYLKVAWDPAEFDEPLSGLNDSFTRTFDILGGNELRFGEGIEIEGRVTLVYNAVPGPGTFTWLTNGLGDWNVGSNWDTSSAPNSNAVTVIFGSDVIDATTVVTNALVTAKAVQFDSTKSYAIAGTGSVTLGADVGNARIDVVQGDHQFQVVVNLNTSETDVNVTAGSSLAFNNALNLNGNLLTKTGTGTMLINNALNTGGGSVAAAAGVVGGSGTIGGNLTNSGATVAPGNSPGKLTVDGNYSQTAGSLEIEINGIDAGQTHDVLSVSGVLTISGGSLDVVTSFLTSPGDTFDVLDFTSADFSGATLNLGTPGANKAWDSSQLSVNGSLTVLSALLGDMDGDLVVTTADAALFVQALVDRAAYDANGFFVDADLNGDVDGSGTFDLGDLSLFSGLLGGPASAAAVPEPTSASFLAMALGVLALVGYRRKGC